MKPSGPGLSLWKIKKMPNFIKSLFKFSVFEVILVVSFWNIVIGSVS